MPHEAYTYAPRRTCESGGGTGAPRGFTLLELLITIVILGFLVSVAAPSFQSQIDASNRRSAVSSLADAISIARAEAVTQAANARLCASSDPSAANPCNATDWAGGYVVEVGGNVVKAWGAAGTNVVITGSGFSPSADEISFLADGSLNSSGSFVFCSASGKEEAQVIVINVSGLSRVGVDTDDDGTVEKGSGAEVVDGEC